MDKKGSKLHSIIEKLSEQCTRVDDRDSTPQQRHVFTKKNDNLVPNSDIFVVNLEPPVQKPPPRKPTLERTRLGRFKKAKKKQVFIEKGIQVSPSDQSTSHNAQYKTTLPKISTCPPVDDDLCININALMQASLQMKDIDNDHNYTKRQAFGACHVCSRTVHSKEDLVEHMKKFHPSECIKTRKGTPFKLIYVSDGESEDLEPEESDDDDSFDCDSDYNPDIDKEKDIVVSKRRSARIKENTEKSNLQEKEPEKTVIQNTNPKKRQQVEEVLPTAKNITCQVCKKQFYFKIELTDHMDKKHINLEKSLGMTNPNAEEDKESSPTKEEEILPDKQDNIQNKSLPLIREEEILPDKQDNIQDKSSPVRQKEETENKQEELMQPVVQDNYHCPIDKTKVNSVDNKQDDNKTTSCSENTGTFSANATALKQHGNNGTAANKLDTHKTSLQHTDSNAIESNEAALRHKNIDTDRDKQSHNDAGLCRQNDSKTATLGNHGNSDSTTHVAYKPDNNTTQKNSTAQVESESISDTPENRITQVMIEPDLNGQENINCDVQEGSESASNSQESDKVTVQDNNQCEHCNRRFYSRSRLMNHIRKVVRKIQMLRRIREARDRKRKQRHKGKSKYIYQCGQCTSKYYLMSTLKKHIAGHQECKCNECGRDFQHLDNLKRHQKNHDEDSRIKCESCDKSFTHKATLKKHIRVVHTKDKSFQCNKCDSCFPSRSRLIIHDRMVHTGEKPYKCKKCGSCFVTRSRLETHATIHMEKAPHQCTLCPKAFFKRNHLKTHMISHSSETPYPCEVCGKAFKRRDHLRYHLIIHSENKPFKCDTCNRTFNQHICLRKHLPCREFERQAKKKERQERIRLEKLAKPKKRKTEQKAAAKESKETPPKKKAKPSDEKCSSTGTSTNTTANETTNNTMVIETETTNKTVSNKTTYNKTASNQTTSNQTTSNQTTSNKTTSNQTMSNKTTSNKTTSNKTTSNKTASNKTSNQTTSNKTISNKTATKETTTNNTSTKGKNAKKQELKTEKEKRSGKTPLNSAEPEKETLKKQTSQKSGRPKPKIAAENPPYEGRQLRSRSVRPTVDKGQHRAKTPNTRKASNVNASIYPPIPIPSFEGSRPLENIQALEKNQLLEKHQALKETNSLPIHPQFTDAKHPVCITTASASLPPPLLHTMPSQHPLPMQDFSLQPQLAQSFPMTAPPHSKNNLTSNFDRLDFIGGFPQSTHSPAMQAYNFQQQRITDTSSYMSSMPQNFVPFSCNSSLDTTSIGFESSGLDIYQGLGSHDNTKEYGHDGTIDLSSALLAAMDPDHLNTLVHPSYYNHT